MRSPLSFLLLTGLLSSGVALFPVLAREIEADSLNAQTVRESLEAVLSQPLEPLRSEADQDSATEPEPASTSPAPAASLATMFVP